MKNIVIYSKPDCPWCDKAKTLLKNYKFAYNEKVLNVDYSKEDLRVLIGPEKKLTVPQIFIDDKLIGGYENLVKYFEDHFIFGMQE